MKPESCQLCDAAAVALFRFSHGCLCDPAPLQYLCAHHAFKSRPPQGGTMELVEDLTAGHEFTVCWTTLSRSEAIHESAR